MTREQLTDTRRKIFCELDSYMKAVCKGTEYCKQWQLWSNCVVNFCDIMKDEIIFLEGIKVFDEILSKLIEEEGTAEEVSGNEVDENEHKKCIMRLEARKARKEKEIIKALQPCTDAISRQAVLEVLNKMDRYVADELTLCDKERKFPQNEVFIVDDVYEEIVEQLPPVTPAEKVGHWIARGLVDSNGNRIYECSECHHSDTQAATMIVPYCWYCGARMQEVEE